MPIQREGEFLVTRDLGITPSVGIESDRLFECLTEIRARQYRGVFGHPSFGFTGADIDFLEHVPEVMQVWFWDVALRSVDGLYRLERLRYFGIHPTRPGIDFTRLPHLETVVWFANRKDSGLRTLTQLSKLFVWHYNPRHKSFRELQLPVRLEELEINWANPSDLEFFPALPALKKLSFHRCRNLRSLAGLERLAPRLEELVVTTSGRLAELPDMAALKYLKRAYVKDRLVVDRASAPAV